MYKRIAGSLGREKSILKLGKGSSGVWGMEKNVSKSDVTVTRTAKNQPCLGHFCAQRRKRSSECKEKESIFF